MCPLIPAVIKYPNEYVETQNCILMLCVCCAAPSVSLSELSEEHHLCITAKYKSN